MLLQFSVGNFMSIRDEVTLSMLANEKDREHEELLFKFRNETVLSSVAIYGANAAGKSNVFKALAAAINIIRQSSSRQVDDRIFGIIPFLFDDRKREEPTTFDFIFTVGDKKYQYGFSATTDVVIDEYLYEYRSSWASKIFERRNTSEYSFTKANEKEFRPYANKNTENKLLLSTATSWNCGKTRDAYRWFANAIDVYDVKDVELLGMPLIAKGNEELRAFLMNTLRKADFNIDDYSFEAKKITMEEFKRQVPPELIEIFEKRGTNGEARQYEITTKHNIKSDKDEVKNYPLSFQAESVGTQRMFFFSAIIKDAISRGKTVIVDEIDSSLHPLLVKFIIGMFSDDAINTNHAQLMFTTHDVSLLSLDLFRRDQIYFVEKNNSNGVTDLYSLDEFSPRKTENIRRGYLQGRYGAIPIIDQGDALW